MFTFYTTPGGLGVRWSAPPALERDFVPLDHTGTRGGGAGVCLEGARGLQLLLHRAQPPRAPLSSLSVVLSVIDQERRGGLPQC